MLSYLRLGRPTSMSPAAERIGELSGQRHARLGGVGVGLVLLGVRSVHDGGDAETGPGERSNGAQGSGARVSWPVSE